MPLLDHFRPPLSDDWPWEGVHSAWATHIAAQLNKRFLPTDYYAIPHIKMGAPVEIDVSSFARSGKMEAESEGGTAVWAPPAPKLVAEIDFSGLDLFEVQVIRRVGGPQLCATIELISPANKERPGHRWAFAVKCASYLQQGVSVMTVDVVTVRTSNMHEEILRALEKTGELMWGSATHLAAIAYRIASSEGKQQVEIWPEEITVGEPCRSCHCGCATISGFSCPWKRATLPHVRPCAYRQNREEAKFPIGIQGFSPTNAIIPLPLLL